MGERYFIQILASFNSSPILFKLFIRLGNRLSLRATQSVSIEIHSTLLISTCWPYVPRWVQSYRLRIGNFTVTHQIETWMSKNSTTDPIYKSEIKFGPWTWQSIEIWTTDRINKVCSSTELSQCRNYRDPWLLKWSLYDQLVIRNNVAIKTVLYLHMFVHACLVYICRAVVITFLFIHFIIVYCIN